MNGTDFLDRVRDDHETALSRLGSSKVVYALTDGEMEATAVRAAAADEAHALSLTVGDWADEGEGAAADLFADVAAMADGHFEAVGPDEYDPADSTALSESLEALDSPVERVAGLAAALTVLGRESEQFVGFFVGEAAPRAADEFRDFRADVEDARDRAAGTIADVADNGVDWDVADAVAGEVVGDAYDWYVETLESMGIKPKNVC